MFLNQATLNVAKILPEMSEASIQQAISGVGSPNLAFMERQEALEAIINIMDQVFIIVIIAAANCFIISSPLQCEEQRAIWL
jgi:hypothetical protein